MLSCVWRVALYGVVLYRVLFCAVRAQVPEILEERGAFEEPYGELFGAHEE